MGILTYRLALAYEKLEENEKSEEFFQNALQVLELTHGKQHKIYKHVLRKLRLKLNAKLIFENLSGISYPIFHFITVLLKFEPMEV